MNKKFVRMNAAVTEDVLKENVNVRLDLLESIVHKRNVRTTVPLMVIALMGFVNAMRVGTV